MLTEVGVGNHAIRSSVQLDKLGTGDNPSNLGMLSKGRVWNHDTRGWSGETMLSEEGVGNHSIRGWGGGP